MKDLVLNISIFFLAGAIPCLAQSKAETQEWIIMQLKRNAKTGLAPADYKFINNEFHLTRSSVYTTIPLKEVSEVYYTINEKYDYAEIKFKLKSKPANYIVSGELLNGEITNSVKWIGNFIQIERSSEKENVPNRLVKAFKHLISLNGGKTVSENTF